METFKRYALSTIVTFLTGFCMVLVLEIDNITLEAFGNGAIVGIVFAAARAGIKGVIEAFLVSRARV